MRRQPARRSNHRIRSTVPKPMMGPSAMAAFATNHDWVTCMFAFSICSGEPRYEVTVRSPSDPRPPGPRNERAWHSSEGAGSARAHVVIRESW